MCVGGGGGGGGDMDVMYRVRVCPKDCRKDNIIIYGDASKESLITKETTRRNSRLIKIYREM